MSNNQPPPSIHGAPPKFLKVNAAAHLLGLSPRRLYQLVSAGKIPFVKFPSGSLRFIQNELESWATTGEKAKAA